MINKAKFEIGSIVKHKYFDFRGVIFDVDPEFNNSEEWYQSIPSQVRPRKDQPFYHLLAEAPSQPSYVAYVSQQNLLHDNSEDPLSHPLIEEMFKGIKNGQYTIGGIEGTLRNMNQQTSKNQVGLGPMITGWRGIGTTFQKFS